MFLPLCCLHIATAWFYAADPTAVEQPGEAITATPSLAVDYGHIIGAADRCTNIDQKRIMAAIVKATLVLRLSAKSRDDFALASAQLNAAIEEVTNAVDYGVINCKQAEKGLAVIEDQKIRRSS